MSCLNIQRLATPLPGKVTIPRVMKCIRPRWMERSYSLYPTPCHLLSHTFFFASNTHFIQTPIYFKHLSIPHTFWNPYPTKVVNHGWSSPSVVVHLPVINLGTFHAYLFADVTIYVSVTCSDIVTRVWFWLRGEGYVLKALENGLCWKKLTERKKSPCMLCLHVVDMHDSWLGTMLGFRPRTDRKESRTKKQDNRFFEYIIELLNYRLQHQLQLHFFCVCVWIW